MSAANQPEGGTSPTPTVLCIDDDPDITAAIELYMRKFDVKVVRAFHGMHGFSEATQHRPDVIVMDLAMPGGDGAAILECLRRNRQTANIPVIILTGMRDHRLARTLKARAPNDSSTSRSGWTS